MDSTKSPAAMSAPRELPVAAWAAGTGEDTVEQDRRHFDAAVQMVADGASRWVLVSGVGDVEDLLSRGKLARRLARITVRAVGTDAVLVERQEAEEPAAATPPARAGIRSWLAAVTHALASLGH